LSGRSDVVIIPGAYFLVSVKNSKSDDFILSRDGHELAVPDYSRGERAALVSPDGALVSGDVVNALPGYVEHSIRVILIVPRTTVPISIHDVRAPALDDASVFEPVSAGLAADNIFHVTVPDDGVIKSFTTIVNEAGRLR
jgi:hypothetical protein